MASLGGNRIYINPDTVLASSDSWNAASFMHELIHNITGKDDVGLQKALGETQVSMFNTTNITKRLEQDCFK
jgi:hypothetical protein